LDIAGKIAQELNIRPQQAAAAVQLLEEGNTVPFIARYRKEVTGSLDDGQLRQLEDRLNYLNSLEKRKQEVRGLLASRDLLSGELEAFLLRAETLVEVEDLYRPFRPRRVTRAMAAREKGLDPLADLMLTLEKGNREEILTRFVDPEKGVEDRQEALQGAMDILAERFTDDASLRRWARDRIREQGFVVSDCRDQSGQRTPYEMYYQFTERISRIAPHRVLALNRGEKEEILSVRLEMPDLEIMENMLRRNVKKKVLFLPEIKKSVYDGYRRLLAPALEREIRGELTGEAEENAIRVFAANLRKLLLQPPVRDRVVLGFDPAFRTGCKLACVDDAGSVLETGVIYPTKPQNRTAESARTIREMVSRWQVDVISLGNGTACRESEEFLQTVLPDLDRPVAYTVTNEAGASVYSASRAGAEEFPELDVTLRSAVSIARRLIDPLAELVKIEPKAIGVGQYQHDVNQKRLGETLDRVVEDCVNAVGVDLNTASVALLRHVAGIPERIAASIVEHRRESGRFRSRRELKKVKGLGPKTFEQAAGFLRIPGGEDLLDNTAVHPESYPAAEKLLKITGFPLAPDWQKLSLEETAREIGVGVPTLRDILQELARPGRDPREELPPPVFRSGVMDLKDLKPGMILAGVVRNVVDFGAFVDIGVHQDGLVHVSRLSGRYVKNPLDVISVGDQVEVRVLEVDLERQRISLSMAEENEND